jgi:shikimate dehydrogenase
MYRLGLTGYPLGHSLSPGIHQAALKAMGLPGEYRLYPVEPLPQGRMALSNLVERMRLGELDGLNVTIPHKPSVLPLLDGLTPSAAGIGAVNTIYREGGRLQGDNTDAPGFLADLERLGVTRPGVALVLGAGGSSRSVVYALVGRGWQVRIAARRLDQAEALAQDVTRTSPASVDPPSALRLSRSEIAAALPVELVANTTPVGMAPLLQADPWPAGLPLPEGAFVYDLIYNPAETWLLSAARKAGLGCANGLGMLVEQAALALERWTGQPVPRQAMWDALEEFIAASQASR